MSHAHWAWQAKFNPAHDQLLLSAGSDSMVNLLHLSGLGGKAAAASNQPPKHSPSRSLSSAPNGTCAASFDCHEDSVYGKAISTHKTRDWKRFSLLAGATHDCLKSG